MRKELQTVVKCYLILIVEKNLNVILNYPEKI